MPHIEKTYPAGVISVECRSEISPVVFPFRAPVFANAFTKRVTTKAATFAVLSKTRFLELDIRRTGISFNAYKISARLCSVTEN
jgi:hypothetical protein